MQGCSFLFAAVGGIPTGQASSGNDEGRDKEAQAEVLVHVGHQRDLDSPVHRAE